MKLKSFQLFLVSAAIVSLAFTCVMFNIRDSFTPYGVALIASVVISVTGLVKGLIEVKGKAETWVWLGMVGNLSILLLFGFIVYLAYEILDKKKSMPYAPSSVIRSVSVNHDTLNSGEVYEVTILSDSSYYNRFGEYPQLKVNNHSYFPLHHQLCRFSSLHQRILLKGQL
ncbi:hypothetical protein [Pontibacter rugosus]